MGQLVDDLLNLTLLTRKEIRIEPVNLSEMALYVAESLREKEPDRRTGFRIQPGMVANADSDMMEKVLTNLIGNAWKFTSKNPDSRIEFGKREEDEDGRQVFFVRDNGAGFDMKYVSKLFGTFQRLHKVSEFPGNGIGLASVQRVIHRHGGRVWAEGAMNQGAVFYFTI
jgi:light-regulated signal transduction histidine kinase (bacteriophytochrome)